MLAQLRHDESLLIEHFLHNHVLVVFLCRAWRTVDEVAHLVVGEKHHKHFMPQVKLLEIRQLARHGLGIGKACVHYKQ